GHWHRCAPHPLTVQYERQISPPRQSVSAPQVAPTQKRVPVPLSRHAEPPGHAESSTHSVPAARVADAAQLAGERANAGTAIRSAQPRAKRAVHRVHVSTSAAPATGAAQLAPSGGVSAGQEAGKPSAGALASATPSHCRSGPPHAAQTRTSRAASAAAIAAVA